LIECNGDVAALLTKSAPPSHTTLKFPNKEHIDTHFWNIGSKSVEHKLFEPSGLDPLH
jgi:hypothetical protein